LDKPAQQRDFFVSYAQADRAWAEWLAWELEAAGYTAVPQAWDMPAGTAFVHAMDQVVQHTRRTILALPRLPALTDGRGGVAAGVQGRPQRRGATALGRATAGLA
jgi:hypothetical protein